MNKPILVFHVGYIPDMNNGADDLYGSEETILRLCDLISSYYDIFIFGECQHDVMVNNIQYYNSREFIEFQRNNDIDVLILFRYIYPSFEIELKARKILLWITDVYPLGYYMSRTISNESKYAISNLGNKIDYFITVSQWHKDLIKKTYNLNDDRVKIINLAINVEYFKEVERIKNRFIWTSNGYRGLNYLLDHFEAIRSILTDAELYVYRDINSFSNEMLNKMKTIPYIHYGGKLDNDELIIEFQKSDYWYYPTNFEETYCISAVEAQMAGCICITSDLAALKETVADRGILIQDDVMSYQYKHRALTEIYKFNQNEEYKDHFRKRGMEWAKKQTWKNRADILLELLKK